MIPLPFDPCPTIDSRDPQAYARYASRLDGAVPDWWTCDLKVLVPALRAEAYKRHPLKCISVRQPWTQLIALGIKSPENRSRNVKHRGLIGIHASQPLAIDVHWNDVQIATIQSHPESHDLLRPLDWRDLPRGAIVAVAELVDCHPARSGWDPCCQPWGETSDGGPIHHLVLRDVRRLETPVPAKGSLVLPWQATSEVAAQVWAQLAEVEV